MCGIVGILSKSSAPISKGHLENMLDTIVHRGPEHRGMVRLGPVELGVQRLSIIDLEGGNQPIFTEDKRYCIVFNGEIYNYQSLREKLIKKTAFKTNSDTEVLLQQFVHSTPEKFLDDVTGVFAFCIWDSVEERLYLGRDRLGEKPLFVWETNDFLYFASEIKAILPFTSIKPNSQAIWDFLSLGYVPGPQTAFEDIRQLPPAHIMVVDQKGQRAFRYWKIELQENSHMTEDEAVKETYRLFVNSVKERLVADVPIGIFLSSGIDSNAILSIFRSEQEQSEINSYTVRFASRSYDESDAVKKLAKSKRIKNEIVNCNFGDLVENFDSIVYHCDNLLANPAILPNYLLSKRANQDLKVVLHGGGGDEIFFGYPTYVADNVLRLFPWLSFLAPVARKMLSWAPASHEKLSWHYKADKFFEGAEFRLERAHYHWRTILTEEMKANLMLSSPQRDTYYCYKKYIENDPEEDFFSRASFADIMVWWTDMGNYQADMISMANSIELRLPFLDHKLVQFVFSIPRNYRFKGVSKKRIFKKAVSGLLPPEILNLPKSGFHVPLAHWFFEERGRRWLLDRLSKKNLQQARLCNPATVESILQDHWSRKRDASFQIFNLLVLHTWHKLFIET